MRSEKLKTLITLLSGNLNYLPRARSLDQESLAFIDPFCVLESIKDADKKCFVLNKYFLQEV